MATRFFSVLALAFAIGMLHGCKSFDGANVNVSPKPLEVHADSIDFKLRASVPPKSGFSKKGAYTGRLVIENKGKTYDVANATIKGSDYPDIKKSGASFSKDIKVAYQEGMEGGKLIAKNTYTKKGKKKGDIPDLELANCCITTSLLLCEDVYPEGANYDAQGGSGMGNNINFEKVAFSYQQSQPVSLEAKFQFPQDVFEIQPTDYEQESIKAIKDFLEQKYEASSITIKGFASPEGTFRRNQFLSIQRSKQVQQWLIQQLDSAGYESHLDSSFFNIETTTEDWDGFKQNLSMTSYSEDVKKQIIEIVSGGYEEDVKERKVMALVGGVEEVEFILAPLRRATILLDGNKVKHSEEEISGTLKGAMAGSVSTDSLKAFFSEEEMLFGIDQFEGDNDRMKLLELYMKTFPEDYRGPNNLGFYYTRVQNWKKAIELFEKANGMKENDPLVMSNLGVAYLKDGQIEKAREILEKVMEIQSTAQAAYNLGVIYHKRANYTQALEMFEKAASEIPCARYNSGLDKILIDDLAGAKAELETYVQTEPENPYGYYLLAIVGAQSANLDLLTLNLQKAIGKTEALSEKAESDLEFRDYYDNARFKSALSGGE